MTTITLNADTTNFLKMFPTRYNYILIDAEGGLFDRNEFGKAVVWSYQQRNAAVTSARRQSRANRECFAYDTQTKRVI